MTIGKKILDVRILFVCDGPTVLCAFFLGEVIFDCLVQFTARLLRYDVRKSVA